MGEHRPAGRLRAAAAGAALTALLAGCASTGGQAGPPEALACELAAAAEDGEVDEAAQRFDRELHQTLHDLADARMDDDRAAAGRLLVAKNQVEELLAEDEPDGGELSDALRQLAGELDDAPPC